MITKATRCCDLVRVFEGEVWVIPTPINPLCKWHDCCRLPGHLHCLATCWPNRETGGGRTRSFSSCNSMGDVDPLPQEARAAGARRFGTGGARPRVAGGV